MLHIEAPLVTSGFFGVYSAENKAAYEQTGDIRYLQSLSRIVIRFDKSTGKTSGFIMTIIPDRLYIEETDFSLKNITYMNFDDFSGIIYYHNLQGQFTNGWRFNQ